MKTKLNVLCSVVRMLNLNVFVRSLLIHINNAYSNGYCKYMGITINKSVIVMLVMCDMSNNLNICRNDRRVRNIRSFMYHNLYMLRVISIIQ